VILPCASFFLPLCHPRRSLLPEPKVHRRILTKPTLPCASLGRGRRKGSRVVRQDQGRTSLGDKTPERQGRMRRPIAEDVARCEAHFRAKLLDTPCRANFGLTHSKQTMGVTIRCHTFRESGLPVSSALPLGGRAREISRTLRPVLNSPLDLRRGRMITTRKWSRRTKHGETT